jgi:hypothetical protein
MFFLANKLSQSLYLRTILVLFLSISIPIMAYCYGTGRTGRTQKTSTQGCSNCHGSTASSGVIVTITGPDTVFVNQTAMFTLTISGGPASGSGCDIAARTGSLSPVSSTIKLSASELTHKANTPMTSGSVSFQFNYIYTTGPIIDTLYATGLSTNSDNSESGDQWNWSPKKVIRVMTPTSVTDEKNIPNDFILNQNYPNPFNPVTNIKFTVAKTGFVSLKVFNLTGQEVATLVNEQKSPGEYSSTWNAASLPSGVYYYRLQAAAFSSVKKLLLLK